MKRGISIFALLVFSLFAPFSRMAGQTSNLGIASNPYNFGTRDIGTTSAPIGVTVTNSAISAVKLTVQPSTPDYEIKKNGCASDVGSKETCVVDVTFSPMAEGTRAGQLTITYPSSAGGTPSSLSPISLTGVGKLSDLGISSTRISFEPQQVGKVSPPQTITLTNNSASDITINNAMTSGDFSLEGFHDAKTLKHGDTQVLVVRFKPSREGQTSGLLTIVSTVSSSPQDVYLLGSTPTPLSGLCAASPRSEFLVVLILCLLYWLAMVVVRWNRIARPTREFLKAELDSLQAELETLSNANQQPNDQFRAQQIRGLIVAARNLIDNPTDARRKRFANVLFWSRGQEMTGWDYVYEAQVQMAALLSDQTVVARLESNEQQLRVANDSPSLALANAIHAQLTATGANVDPLRRKALLAEALNANFDREGKDFSALVSWQNKTAWLVGCGLILILALTAAIHHHSILFLVGATGGLISRLSRSLDRKDVPSDYGASWTTLFLSPVAGALGAWAGILLSGLAVNLKVLGDVFNVGWTNAPCQPTTLAIALVFGFSERLLDGVFDKLVEKTGVVPATSTNPQPPQKTTSNPPPANGQNADQNADKGKDQDKSK